MIEMDEQTRRLKILLHGMNRCDQYFKVLKKWTEETTSPRDRWFRETAAKLFIWTEHTTIQDALNDPVFLKKVYERMYPSFLKIIPSFQDFIQAVEMGNFGLIDVKNR